MPARPSQSHPIRVARRDGSRSTTIKPAKDTTLAMLLAAQKRGWELWYAEQRDLWLRDGVAFGRLRPLQRARRPARLVRRSVRRRSRPLADFDVILMRKDPPFDMEYIYTTYILERAEEQGVLVVNRPQGLRDMNEKVYTAWFPQCCAPTLITRDMADMHAFLQRAPAHRLQAAARHGRPLDLRHRPRRQERQRDLRDPDRVRHALRDRAEVHSRHRGDAATRASWSSMANRRRTRWRASPRRPTIAATSPRARAAKAAS